MRRATAALASCAIAIADGALDAEVAAVARQCVVDAIGVGLAAAGDADLARLEGELVDQGGKGEAAMLGTTHRVPASQAALYNGAAIHLLDYDDVNLAITGHATAVVLPVLLSLAQESALPLSRVLSALVAGTDVACRLGRALAPDHYARGFHATATTGAIAAAAAGAALLGLDVDTACRAMGLAGTQAAGLRAAFGTFAKPLHAGLAARNALLSIRLAQRGVDAPRDIVEHPQGLAALTDSIDLSRLDIEPPRGAYLRETLFKYSPSCFGTAAPIETARRARERLPGDLSTIVSVRLTVHPSQATICNLATPRTSAELRFSMRATVAMTLTGLDMGRLDVFDERVAVDPVIVDLVGRSDVAFDERLGQMAAVLTLRLVDGGAVTLEHDAGVAADDVGAQGRRVTAKFRALVTRVPPPVVDAWLRDVEAGVEDVLSIRRLEAFATGSRSLVNAG